MLDAKNVDSKLSADIQFANAFPDPAFWYFHLKNGVLLVDLYIVEDIVGADEIFRLRGEKAVEKFKKLC